LNASDNDATQPLNEMLLLEQLCARLLDMIRVDASMMRDTKFSTPTAEYNYFVTDR
jgi:hypothetical protein